MAIALKAYGGLANDFRQVNTSTGAPMPWPTIDPTGIVGTLLSENTQVSEVDFTFGQGMLSAWTITSGVHLVSVQVAEDSAFDLDSFIGDRVGESIGRKLASLAVSGTGSSQPLDVITAISAKGVYGGAGTSGGYVALTAATTVKTFASSNPTELSGNLLHPQSLVNMIQAIDPSYYPSSKWYFNAAQAWNLRTVVDSNGRPILNFANGFTADDVTAANYRSGSAVASLFGFDVMIDNSIPNLTASTVGGPVFGSLQHAMVQRNVGPTCRIMRLDQRYADYLQVGYIGYLRTDMRSK
jgi:HK97 family phage major capsid protein